MDNLNALAEKYKMLYDHHTHTTYSHGTGSIEDNVKVAVSKGLQSIAITDHGPGHLTYGIKTDKLAEMRSEVERLRAKYPQIEILLGVEANTLRIEPYLDVDDEMKNKFDILLAGYHFGIPHAGMIPNYLNSHLGIFGGKNSKLMVKNNEMMLNAIYNNDIDIITHPGDKGPFNIREIAKACADTDTLIEINGKHKHLTVEEIKIAAQFPVKFVIGSDAHVPENVGEFKNQLIRALEAGLDTDRIVNIEKI